MVHVFGNCKWMITGGFGGNIGHDPHLAYTLSAVQVLALFDRLDVLDIEKVSDCILLGSKDSMKFKFALMVNKITGFLI